MKISSFDHLPWGQSTNGQEGAGGVSNISLLRLHLMARNFSLKLSAPHQLKFGISVIRLQIN